MEEKRFFVKFLSICQNFQMNYYALISGLTKSLVDAKALLTNYSQTQMNNQSINKFYEFWSCSSISEQAIPATMVSAFMDKSLKRWSADNKFISEENQKFISEDFQKLSNHVSYNLGDSTYSVVSAIYNNETRMLNIRYFVILPYIASNGRQGAKIKTVSSTIKCNMSYSWYIVDTTKVEFGKITYHNYINYYPAKKVVIPQVTEMIAMSMAPVALGLAKIPDEVINIWELIIADEIENQSGRIDGLTTKEECQAAMSNLETVKLLPLVTIDQIFPPQPVRPTIPVEIDEDEGTVTYDPTGLDEETLEKIKELLLKATRKPKKNSRGVHSRRRPQRGHHHHHHHESNGAPVFQTETSPTWSQSWEEDI